MNKEELQAILEKHQLWIDGEEGGERANLRGADLDYSCLPLWCGSLGAIVDKRIAAQIAYHFCRLNCDDPEYITARNAILDFANQFHCVGECGELEKIENC